MTKKYYIQNMFWGWFIVAGIFYSFWGVDKNSTVIILFISAISGILYPFSKFLIEKVVIKNTGKSMWETGLFRDGIPKTKIIIFYYIICLLLAIPLGLCCIANELKNRH